MKIKFLNIKRIDANSVEVTYLFSNAQFNDTEFTVQWNNIHHGTGEIIDYELQLETKSSNSYLADMVDEAIREGETDDNPNLSLYLFIRDMGSICEGFQ